MPYRDRLLFPWTLLCLGCPTLNLTPGANRIGAISSGLVVRSGCTAALACCVLLKCERGRFRRSSTHQPVKVRTRPYHDVIICHDLTVVPLARDPPKPVAHLARLHAHRLLLGYRNERYAAERLRTGSKLGQE